MLASGRYPWQRGRRASHSVLRDITRDLPEGSTMFTMGGNASGVDASVRSRGLYRTQAALMPRPSYSVEREGLRVPVLWAREIANGLAVAYLRKRITSSDEKAFLAALSHLAIDVEEFGGGVCPRRHRHSRWNGGSDALWPYGLRRGVRRSCCARKTDSCNPRAPRCSKPPNK